MIRGPKDGVIARLALDAGDEARLIEKPDGWYVEVQVGNTLSVAGPTPEAKARAVWRELVVAVERQ